MGMSAAERMKKYRQRIKNDPERYNEYVQKEKRRYRSRKEKGEFRNIASCSDREKRAKRRKWKIEKRKQRKHKKQQAAALEKIMTPPQSPILQTPDIGQPGQSRQKITGARVARRNRAKLKIQLKQATESLKTATLKAEKYRKRWERERKRKRQNKTSIQNKLKHKNEALFNSLIVKGIREKMRAVRSEKQRQILSKMVSTEILKKHRLMYLAKICNVSYKRLRSNFKKTNKTLTYERRVKANAVSSDVRQNVCSFLELDINSRMMPGKKDTITRNGVKKQKRILNDSLKNLYKTYKKKSTFNISYSTFCRVRPFWILEQKSTDRDTCTCKVHANIQFKVDKLIEHKVLPNKSLDEFCNEMCCQAVTKECMYRECSKCKDKLLTPLGEFDEGKQVSVYVWQSKLEEREIVKANGDSNKIKVQITAKDKVQYNLKNLYDETITDFTKKFCRHNFNIKHQFRQIRQLKESLSCNECVVHIDFSENYACKLSQEVQGMHFGASRNQISLHTGVVYMHNKKPSSFCTISSCTRHDPCAIWAHLNPVLQTLKNENSEISTIHFLSDGPTTQYRSKKNFYLLNNRIHSMYGIKSATWNFTEAGHGKGAPDGIGGLVKRTADKAVSYGKDVCDIKDMQDVIEKADIAVKIYVVQESDIDSVSKSVPQIIKSVPNTMKTHQILSFEKSPIIHSRDLSCFCKKPELCECFDIKQTDLTTTKQPSQSQSETDNNPQHQQSVADSRTRNETILSPVNENVVDTDIIGQWVVVEYDSNFYPGVVQNVDHEGLEVKVLHKIGRNRYFWPLIDDIIWYNYPQVITLIPEPTYVTKRHLEIRPDIWNEISKSYE